MLNVNDKKPVFKPAVQRAGVSADAETGTLVYQLVAEDPDADEGSLRFGRGDRPVRAVDVNGQEVTLLYEVSNVQQLYSIVVTSFRP